MMPDGALAMPAAALAAVLLDRLLGEVRRFHPLVGFGNLATAVEKRLNNRHLPAGLLAWVLVVLPFVALAFALRPMAPFAVDVALLYFALGAQSLCEHAEAIAKPLQDGRLDEARQRVGWIVSRDTSALDEAGGATAGMESVLENGNDAIFGTLFWFALLGHTRQALACWRTQAPGWDSPTAGPVMSAGAGSLGVQLGGAAIYHGQLEQRPPLGTGPAPVAADLGRAIALIRHSLYLWLAAFFVIGFLHA